MPDQYAQYRLLFLMVNAAMALAPMFMSQALFYFFPRAQTAKEKGLVLGNTLFFLMVTGAISGVVIYPGLGLFPEKFYEITHEKYLIPCFVCIWVVSTIIDVLPNALNRIRSQAIVMLSLSVMRVFVVVYSAWSTGRVEYVFYALCLFAVIKAAVLIGYSYLSKDIGSLSLGLPKLKEQLSYSLPFGIAGGLYMLKVQADQWIAAYQFSPKEYAIFTFGIYIAPLMTVLRTSINNAVLPEMSAAYAEEKYSEVASIFRRTNFLMALIILPILAVLYATADSIISILFTKEYSGATPIMRIYIVGFVAQCLESNSILRLTNAGKFWIKLNAILLIVAAVFSYLGALFYGLPGAALGSVITLYFGEIISLVKASNDLRIPFSKIIQWKKWSALFCASFFSAFMGGLVAINVKGVAIFQMSVVTLSVLISYFAFVFILLPLPKLKLSPFKTK